MKDIFPPEFANRRVNCQINEPGEHIWHYSSHGHSVNRRQDCIQPARRLHHGDCNLSDEIDMYQENQAMHPGSIRRRRHDQKNQTMKSYCSEHQMILCAKLNGIYFTFSTQKEIPKMIPQCKLNYITLWKKTEQHPDPPTTKSTRMPPHQAISLNPVVHSDCSYSNPSWTLRC